MPKNLLISTLLDYYGDVLTEKQRNVIIQYHSDDLSLGEIAENLGITRQGVRDSIKRGEHILLDLEEKIGFLSYQKKTNSFVKKLSELSSEIAFENNNSINKSFAIYEKSEKIKNIILELQE